jgi:hypothetical protein
MFPLAIRPPHPGRIKLFSARRYCARLQGEAVGVALAQIPIQLLHFMIASYIPTHLSFFPLSWAVCFPGYIEPAVPSYEFWKKPLTKINLPLGSDIVPQPYIHHNCADTICSTLMPKAGSPVMH